PPDAGWKEEKAPLREVSAQLKSYFNGKLREFDLPLLPRGTPFQLEVWKALRGIPFGETISYAELARRIGKPSAMRAVGAANGQNPISIVIPCHRVIGSDGSLTGYGGGMERKAYLLALEGSSTPRLFKNRS
ncbi:MAG TPA: methylated-DNA--[protein]-cysteine S-methyltransferase, partial [Blastocatellia bacterium]|nr:methylated-DNA--[protein]-cysteine S-methyltransferase [Blastocatellia bacterium]